MFVLSSPSSFVVVAAVVVVVLLATSSPTTVVVVVDAFTNGAGGCSGQRGSVGSLHVTGGGIEEESNRLSLQGLQVRYLQIVSTGADSTTLDSTITTSLATNAAYNVFLEPTTGSTTKFKGFLFRLAGDGNGAATDTESYVKVLPSTTGYSQSASVCNDINIGGVTHKNSNPKQTAKARIKVSTPGTYTLQVTAVIENHSEDSGEWESIWAYETFVLRVSGDDTSSGSSSNNNNNSNNKCKKPGRGCGGKKNQSKKNNGCCSNSVCRRNKRGKKKCFKKCYKAGTKCGINSNKNISCCNGLVCRGKKKMANGKVIITNRKCKQPKCLPKGSKCINPGTTRKFKKQPLPCCGKNRCHKTKLRCVV